MALTKGNWEKEEEWGCGGGEGRGDMLLNLESILSTNKICLLSKKKSELKVAIFSTLANHIAYTHTLTLRFCLDSFLPLSVSHVTKWKEKHVFCYGRCFLSRWRLQNAHYQDLAISLTQSAMTNLPVFPLFMVSFHSLSTVCLITGF